MRAFFGRTKHLGAAQKIRAPDAPETLVELDRVECVNTFPVSIEALRPGVQRQRIVAAQIFNVDNLEAGILHQRNRIGEARYPATGENVVTDEEFRFAASDVADEVQHA